MLPGRAFAGHRYVSGSGLGLRGWCICCWDGPFGESEDGDLVVTGVVGLSKALVSMVKDARPMKKGSLFTRIAEGIA